MKAAGGTLRISVIVKALDEGPRIRRALASALAAVAEVADAIGGEVILADSGSRDDTVAQALRLPVRVVQLANPREQRCGVGPELGWRQARGEYLYLMDGDMELAPGFLAPALDFLARHPEVAGVGGRVIERNLGALEYRERERRAQTQEAHRRPGPVDRLDGGGLYRRRAIAEAGYFSDRNLHSYEELDLALRLRARDWRLWRLSLPAVSHEGHADSPWTLLARRWRSGYAWGCGELLRAALGQPWWPLLLRDLRELRIYLAVWAWWGAMAALFALGLIAPRTQVHPLALEAMPVVASLTGLAWSALALLAVAPWAVMTRRRQSAAAGAYTVASWCVHAAGLLPGLLARRRPPTGPLAMREPGPPADALAAAQVATHPAMKGIGHGTSATPLPWLPSPRPRERHARTPVILVACPWTPVGGGMYKVADYLLRAQAAPGAWLAGDGPEPTAARLRPLDTRGGGSAAASMGVLARAVCTLLRGRLNGEVAGVHVNMAERLSLVRKGALIAACHALGLPVVLHLHAAQLHRAWPRLPAPARGLLRWVFSLPRACIVLGPQSEAFVTGTLRVPPEQVRIVTNGVPPPRLPRHRPDRDGLQLLFVGNLSARKGLPELLQALGHPALASLPLTLTLAGGGDLPAWRERAERLGLAGRVRFTGWAEGEKLAALMAGADALVLPSHDEGLPLVLLEALAQGLPVVCTPVGEIAAHLQDGRHAVFVPPGDAPSLALALGRVLGDARLRERLALEGRALWQREFSLARFFLRVAAVHASCFGVSATLPAGRDTAHALVSGAGRGAGLATASPAPTSSRPPTGKPA